MTNRKEIGWNFDNSYARLPETFFAKQKPTPVKAPKLVVFNKDLAASLGLDASALQTEEAITQLSGNEIPKGADPLAQAYAGHQFGHFTMLGDGRAVLLGEQVTPNGERYDLQLKGSGRTPYSRGGDGRAALGPMLREYIISEAMHGLGIPTTRSLAVVTTGEEIIRETELLGAILTRVAASHIRVGTFQYAANFCTVEELKVLANYTIQRHYPDVQEDEAPYLSFFRAVMKRQAELVAKWQLVGFIHGVMNTDNMAISGETIDYGPCAFMDVYDPETVFSSIDTHGRYAYVNQPPIAAWNLARFAETILPLLADNIDKAVDMAQTEISKFRGMFEKSWLAGMRSKLGLFQEEPEDKQLVEDLLEMMYKHRADYTNTFRALTLKQFNDGKIFATEEFSHWKIRWRERQNRESQSQEAIKQLMRKNNPAVIPRNHRVEEALDAAVQCSDLSVMDKLLNVLKNPYAYSKEQESYVSVPEQTMPYRTFCGT